MAYGKKVVVKSGLENYVIGIVGPSGFGKSTLMYHMCKKLFGEDGYLAIDFGLENGYGAIDGAVVETCPNWQHFNEVVEDIVENKEKDYPNLKVIICDTIDIAFECAENYCIRKYNSENLNEKDFKKATTVNQIYGGFSGGYDAVIRVFKEAIRKLRSVGVGMFFAAHCKEKEFADMFTGASYSQLTANMTARYFNAVKDISDVIGFGYYSRDVEHKDVGVYNPITRKKKGRDEIVSECRKIKFRDDSYLLDAKSRFAQIVPEINLDTDEFIKAIQDAIASASNGSPEVKAQKTIVSIHHEDDFGDDMPPFEVEDGGNSSDSEKETNVSDDEKLPVSYMIKEIRSSFQNAEPALKKNIKSILIENGNGVLSEDLPYDVLAKIYKMIV